MSTGTPHAMRAAVAGMIAMAVCMGVGRFVFTPILPHMLSANLFSTADAGVMAGLNFLGYLLGAIGAAWQGFARHRRTWFVIALLASAATTLAMGLTGDFILQCVLRFASGVASAFAMIFVTTMVMAVLHEEGRERLIAVHFAGVGTGILVSALLVSGMVETGAGWRWLWLAAGILAFAGWLSSFLLSPRPPVPAKQPVPEASARRRRTPGFSAALWLLIGSYGCFGFGYVITATFINTIAVTAAHSGTGDAASGLAAVEPWLWPAVGMAAIPSVWLWNKLAQAAGIFTTYAIACLAEAAGIGVLLIWVTPLSLVVSGVLLGGTFVAITAIGLAKARNMAGYEAPAAIALMTAAFGAGQILGPVFAGYAHELWDSFAPSLEAAMIALLFAVVLTVLAARSERA